MIIPSKAFLLIFETRLSLIINRMQSVHAFSQDLIACCQLPTCRQRYPGTSDRKPKESANLRSNPAARSLPIVTHGVPLTKLCNHAVYIGHRFRYHSSVNRELQSKEQIQSKNPQNNRYSGGYDLAVTNHTFCFA